MQNRSVLEGYDQTREDALLVDANWQVDDAAAILGRRLLRPGGGLVNQLFRNILLARPEVSLMQVLGGVATNVPMKQHPIGLYRQEYAGITGAEFAVLPVAVSAQTHLGNLSEPARRFLQG